MLVFLKRVERIRPFFRFSRRNFYVLGIESSCDDTSAAVISDCGRVLGEGHFSQSRLHLEAGGIIPIIASNLHRQHLKSIVNASINQSTLNFKDLTAIAVTTKPGLLVCLQAGLEYAKDLCALYSKPMIPIHHMEAHALMARMTNNVKFPFLVLLISGGHCILGIAESPAKFYKLGESLDSPPGNILDKIARRARMKNLVKFKHLMGGGAIEAAAREGDPHRFHFQQFAAEYISKEEKELGLGPDAVIPSINDLCAGVLMAMSNHLCQRLEIAMHYVRMKELLGDEKCLVVSGGVACNKIFQQAFRKVCDLYEYRMVVPPDKLCTDNGVMIAWNGIERLKENLPVVQPDDLASVIPYAWCPFGEDLSKDVKEAGKQMTFKFMKLKDLNPVKEKYGRWSRLKRLETFKRFVSKELKGEWTLLWFDKALHNAVLRGVWKMADDSSGYKMTLGKKAEEFGIF